MNVFAAANECWETGRSAALVTVIGVGGSAPRAAGARMLVYADASIVGTIGGGTLEHRSIAAAIEAIRSGAPRRLDVHLVRDLGMCCGGAMEIFIEPVETRSSIVIFGAGHVAEATAPALLALDFAVTIVDERPEWCSEERFAGCQIELRDAVEFARSLPDDPSSHRLVVTHDHALDQHLVEALLPKQCAWLGMIGSRTKVAKFFMRYKAAGMDEALFKRLSAPVGLDIGAQTPAEIAVAIAAELVRLRRSSDSTPVPLSDRPMRARGD